MKLRMILLALSLLVLVSTSVGGYLYYASLKEATLHEAKIEADSRARMITDQLSSYLSANLQPVQALAGLPELRRALADKSAGALADANTLLDTFKSVLAVDVCYLMDANGRTVASSNRYEPDSFVGQDFGYRPYFTEAMKGFSATYMALGATSGVRGAYYSHPVYASGSGTILGVAVIKTPIGVIEDEFLQAYPGTVLLVSPDGVIFGSSRPEWLFRSLNRLGADEIEALAASRQFGDGPWPWSGLELELSKGRARDTDGREMLASSMELPRFRGWRIYYLRDIDAIPTGVPTASFRASGSVVLVLCLLVGLIVSALYLLASKDIALRKRAEAELLESKERYRSLYHNTPAMLHSIDAEGRLLSVSDSWVEMMGYSREEAVGMRILDFHTDKSRDFAKEQALPEFFRTGEIRDVPYQFATKDGRDLDVLLSATAERDAEGNVIRSVAVSVDITARKKAEEELMRAKELLARYSEDLERQVAERTREITSILRHTPAIVSIKDAHSRFVLVNPHYEEVFGVRSEAIMGRTARDVHAPATARTLEESEREALETRRPVRVEESFRLEHGDRTYLSVKFPILDDQGDVIRVCGIGIDISELKDAQDKLRRVSGSVLASQERERAAIARRLHDELGQVLTVLRMDAVWLRDRLRARGAAAGQDAHPASDPALAERSEGMCELIDATISDVRHIATRLRPAVLDDLGLHDALEWYAADFERRTGIRCRLESAGVEETPERLATATYRVTQEALTNVARHADADEAVVRLARSEGHIELRVRDDGRGFDPVLAASRDTLGLAGMQERAGLAGGVLEIRSAPGRGTEIRLRLPLDETEQAAPTGAKHSPHTQGTGQKQGTPRPGTRRNFT
jgi:PAS domain S-box-containing protein